MKFVNELMAVLKYQNIDIWDYSNEIEAIEAGTVIEERLKKEILDRSVFIPLVSINSVNPAHGRYTMMETMFAIENGKSIIPVILTGAPDPSGWPAPYSLLKDLIYLRFDLWTTRILLEIWSCCVQNFIRDFNLSINHIQGCLWSFFRTEIHEIPKSNYHYGLLMTILWNFNKAFFNQDWTRAEKLIDLFIRNCGIPCTRLQDVLSLHCSCSMPEIYFNKTNEAEVVLQ